MSRLSEAIELLNLEREDLSESLSASDQRRLERIVAELSDLEESL